MLNYERRYGTAYRSSRLFQNSIGLDRVSECALVLIFLAHLTSESLGTDIAFLRSDWQSLVARHLENGFSETVIDLVEYRSHRDEDATWIHGISPFVDRNSNEYIIAKRFVVTNAALLDVVPDHTTTPRFVLDSNKGVLSVYIPDKLGHVLRVGLALLTTSDGKTWYILSDTGRIVGNEDDGIDPLCQELLNCDERGIKRT